MIKNISEILEVRGKLLDRGSRSVKLRGLSPNTRYRICVVGLGSWGADDPLPGLPPALNASTPALAPGRASALLADSPTTRCTEVRTLEATDALLASPGGGGGGGSVHGGVGPDGEDELLEREADASGAGGGGGGSLLTRRLGLIVGSCMGFVVFVVLVSVLGYFKLTKQRQQTKREQPIAQEYISYRHFSIQSGDAGLGAGPVTLGTTSLDA
ncbi:Uncharacterized protein GBIM_14166 [Gryllus bimaculatus]|nr:Uncharacterized protein GBIM_14166 [Gryllus bimaculatus]